jgi:signal transduction histidine kinase
MLAKMEPDEKRLEYLDKIYDRTKVLDAVVSDLNQLLTAKNAPIEYLEIDFDELHNEICRQFEAFPGFKETAIDFKWTGQFPFVSDKRRIYSIYQNLFENAIKYRDKKKESTLSIQIDSNKKECRWMFKDNGIGIEESQKEKVFNMFHRANDTIKDSNGLGLYLVKVAVEKLNGEIILDSHVGQGTTFHIIFQHQPS